MQWGETKTEAACRELLLDSKLTAVERSFLSRIRNKREVKPWEWKNLCTIREKAWRRREMAARMAQGREP